MHYKKIFNISVKAAVFVGLAIFCVAIYDCVLLKPDEWQSLKAGFPIDELPPGIILEQKEGVTVGRATRNGVIGVWKLTFTTYGKELSNVNEVYDCKLLYILNRARNR